MAAMIRRPMVGFHGKMLDMPRCSFEIDGSSP
jgi:hypothetical protein